MKRSFTLLIILIVASLLISFIDSFAIGSLFVRPRWSEQEYQKVWIKSIAANIDIQEQIAITYIDQVFFNEMDESVEAVYLFPLPENAVITELVYWVNGERFVAEIRERQDAINAYNEKLRQWLDPALLEELGNNLFRLKIVPVNPLTEIRTEITYAEPLEYDMGVVNYEFQLNTFGLSSKNLETVALSVNAKSNHPYKSFFSPSHTNPTSISINKVNDNHYTVFYGDENYMPDKNFNLQFETIREDVDFKILKYTPVEEDSIGTDNYFSLWITPPDSLADDQVIPKNIVFTADVSSSMEGERLRQLKETLNNFLSLLQPHDHFNILTFGTFVNKFQPDLVKADETNIAEALDFVNSLSALGLTNINEALVTSLQQSFLETTSNNLIFLTDGKPTWGETSNPVIVENTINNNNNSVRIFSFGIGEDISRSLLADISEANSGYAKFIASDDSIALVVNKHFSKISMPVLTNITINLGGLDHFDTYPNRIPDLFFGSQILYVGKYLSGGIHDITVSGKVLGETKKFSRTIDLNDPDLNNLFVSRLWARKKINDILDQIEAYGEIQELIDQVIALSMMYQILTPYTAFYVDPDVTNVQEENMLPEGFTLKQNYPNPFNPETIIEFSIPKQNSSIIVSLKVYNVLGELVSTIIQENLSGGTYKYSWNGKDSSGNELPSGIYIYTLESGIISISKKMILLR